MPTSAESVGATPNGRSMDSSAQVDAAAEQVHLQAAVEDQQIVLEARRWNLAADGPVNGGQPRRCDRLSEVERIHAQAELELARRGLASGACQRR